MVKFDSTLTTAFLQSSAGEWAMILSLVFGGCCSNVWALEGVLKSHPKAGTFLTFAQFIYVAIQNLSSQVEWRQTKSGFAYPTLKSRKVPLRRWLVQVVLFLAISLMNNYAFGLKIPVTVHIIFRSGGLCVSMLVGHFAGGRRYSLGQVLSSILITIGIVLATLSAPHRKSPRPSSSDTFETTTTTTTSWIPDELEYFAGIILLAAALFLSAFLGLWQESTYRVYGKQWKEALFYGHFLSLPFFIPFYPTLSTTFNSFASSAPITLFSLPQPSLFAVGNDMNTATQTSKWGWLRAGRDIVVPSAIFALLLNVFTQGLCIRGVNRLTTRVNAVTVNLILTVRKAVSLAISVWYYGSGFSTGLAIGGGMVMLGTILYSVAPGPKSISETPSSNLISKASPQPATTDESDTIAVIQSSRAPGVDVMGLRQRQDKNPAETPA
ncbi:hypothetical protein IAR55_006722 [Kwoniella newhampshirensis]|uniref:Solute carrier family 35 (UDP-xylose/UDP-N-acetylglucosamine transporter), member B4 n=1 Tax=Kwoniella newhampshirensis TaxID=1651941 RepID=A0AAW0YEA8_9TREE